MTSPINRFAVLLFIFLPSFLSAQFNIWGGGVIDAETMEGIPYAIVQAEGTGVGVTTNASGEFTLKIPSDKTFTHFKVICMGYKTAIVPIPSKTPTTHLELALIPDGVEVQGLTISQERMEAKEYLEEAFSKMKENNPTFPYTLRGFYRHYCRDGEIYGRLIEAAAEIHDLKGYPKLTDYYGDRYSFTVNQLRRSYDYSSLYTRDHAPISIMSLVSRDPMAHPSYLNDHRDTYRKLNDDLAYEFGTSTMMDGRPVQVIEYTENRVDEGKIETVILEKFELRGKFYIDAESMAILALEESTDLQYYYPNQNQRTEGITNRKIKLSKWGDKYFPIKYESVDEFLTWEIRPEKPDSLTYDHWVHIEFQTNEVDIAKKERPEYQELDYFVLKAVPYDSNFWDGYNILKATPLEDSITADLEKKMALRTQFQTYHERVMRDQFDSTAAAALHHFEEKFQSRPRILVYWRLPDSTSMQSKPFQRHYKKCLKAGIPSFQMCMDMDKEDYERSKMVFKQFQFGYPIREGKTTTWYPVSSVWGGYGLKSEVAERKGVGQAPTLIIERPNADSEILEAGLNYRIVISSLKRLRYEFRIEQRKKKKREKSANFPQ